jgi:hypothetical protein
VNIDATAQKVMDTIDVDELVKVALDLGNIDSPTGSEGRDGDQADQRRRRSCLNFWLVSQKCHMS